MAREISADHASLVGGYCLQMSEIRKPPLGLKLIASLAALIIFLFVAEMSLKLFEDNLYYKNQLFPLNRDLDFPEIYKKDVDLFWRFRPDQVTNSKQFSYLSYHINSRGRRGPEPVERKPAYRILALGNSCTFGWGVEYDNIWTTRLERMLSKHAPNENIQLINAGVPGYSSHQGKIYFANELLELKPDIVLISFAWNDQWPAGKGTTDAEQESGSELLIAAQNIVSKLRTYRLMRKVVLGFSEQEVQVSLDQNSGKRRVPLEQFYKNLLGIIEIARENKIEPVLLIPPVASLENYFTGTVSDFHQRHLLYQSQIIRAAKYAKAEVIDLQTEFDLYSDLFTDAEADPVHFNEKGHQVVAEVIARALMSELTSKL